MEYYAEWRLKGDEYGGGFGNGITLAGGSSVQKMTCVADDANETVFAGEKGHRLRCRHTEKDGVITFETTFENPTEEAAALELLSSFAVKGIHADRLHRATSFWSAEGKLLSQDLTELNMEPSWAKHGFRIEKFGQLGSMPVRKWFPFFVLEDSENSRFFGVQLYCPSSWQMEMITKDESVTVQGGIADRDYGQWSKTIAPGESFTAPKAVAATGNSLLEVCDKLVKAQCPDIADIDRDLPIIFNEYCTSWGNPTLENIRKTAERLRGSGVRYLVIDSGWYKTPDKDWFSATGDWLPEATLFPNGIKEVAEIIKENGMVPGLWYEYESLGALAQGWHDTAHLLCRDGVPATVGGRRFWDMRQEWVWRFLDERVLSLLKDNGFGYIKIDYNETIGAGVDGAESYGEGLRQTVEASRRYMAHLKEEMPQLVIENCSSGGHRLEPSFMETASMASFSDAHECACIPLIAANLQRLIRPEQSQIWAVLRRDADEKRIHYLLTAAMLGRLCLSGEIFDLNEAQWQSVLDGMAFYHQIRHIIKNGATTVLDATVKNYAKPRGFQAVRREYQNEALLIIHTFDGEEMPNIKDYLGDYRIKASYGTAPTDTFCGMAYLLEK